LSETEQETLKQLVVDRVEKNFSVQLEAMSESDMPLLITRPEFMRRMKDMAAMSGPMGSFYANMPDEVTLTVNGNNPIYASILKVNDQQLQEKQVRNLADLALLSQGMLKGAQLTDFIKRSTSLMQDAAGKN
jgi:molecular chaperone HtpG